MRQVRKQRSTFIVVVREMRLSVLVCVDRAGTRPLMRGSETTLDLSSYHRKNGTVCALACVSQSAAKAFVSFQLSTFRPTALGAFLLLTLPPQALPSRCPRPWRVRLRPTVDTAVAFFYYYADQTGPSLVTIVVVVVVCRLWCIR